MSTTAYDKSIFKQFFDSTDTRVVAWRDNMLDKLYKRGIIPEYVIRNENANANGEDDDYISFWKAIAEYFAFYVVYSREFLNIENNRELLLDFLYERNVGESPDAVIGEMQYLMYKLYDDTRLRGTAKVFEKVPQGDPRVFDGVHLSGVVIHGEFVRSISHDYQDELMVIMTHPSNFGWCVGRCSPMYRGTLQDYQLIKAYEDTDYAADLSKYPLLEPLQISIFTDVSISRDVLKFDTYIAGAVGIGINPKVGADKLIVIDPAVNYEITFQCKSANDALTTFGVLFYDKDFNTISTNFHIDGSPAFSKFFTSQPMWMNDQYYFVRGVLFGVNEPLRSSADSALDFGVGMHIQIPCNAVYILPMLTTDADPDTSMNICVYDFKVRIADTVYSRGFIQTPNVIQIWAKNNNGLYNRELQQLISIIHPISYQNVITIPLLEEFVKRYLIPYNSTILFNWLSEESICGIDTEHSYDPSYDDSFS